MSENLLFRTVSGFKWSTFSQIGKQVLHYITLIILVSILSPSDFGLMAMAVIVIGFLDIFKDLGTASAIIQKLHPSESLKSSIFWVNLIVGALISILVYFSASIIGEIYGNKQVIPLLRVLSITFFISGSSILQKALLEKEMEFNKLAKIEVFSSAVSFMVAVVMAYSGYGVWSLVFQSITFVLLTSFLIIIVSKWLPNLNINLKEIKSISNYSLNLVGFNIINYFSRNADYFLIGKYLGDRPLGHYYLAYRIMLYPLQNISVVVSRVIFPSFSSIQKDNTKLKAAYTTITNAISLITFPLMLGIAAISFDFTHQFFGDTWDWKLLAVLLIILAPVGAMQSIISTVGNIYQVKGRTDWMFRWSIFASSITTVGFIIGLKWGVTGVAMSYLITNLLLLYPVFAIPFRLVDLNIGTYFNSFSKTLLSSIIMVCSVLLIMFIIGFQTHSLMKLILLIFTGIVVYILISIMLNSEKVNMIKDLFYQYKNDKKKILDQTK